MKPIYVGVEDKAVVNSEIYAGVDDIARKVSRMYIGDDTNIARLCYDATRLVSTDEGTITHDFTGTLTKINHRTYTEFADRLVLSGGIVSSSTEYSDKIDIIDSSLTVTSLEMIMDAEKYNHCSCVIDDKYLAFFGGFKLNNSGETDYHKGLEIYDKAFTKVLQQSLFHITGSAGGSIGKYGVFYSGVGKVNADTTQYLYDKMLCIDDDLTITYKDITLKRSRAGAAFNKNKHILFAGGNSDAVMSEHCNHVEAFDTSLTRYEVADISSNCIDIKGANVGDYYLFGSPVLESGYSKIVYVYDDSLTKRSNLELHASKLCAVVGTGDEAVFAGGYSSGDSGSVTGYDTIEIFDTNLTKTSMKMTKNYGYAAKGAKIKDKIIMFFEHSLASEILKLK